MQSVLMTGREAGTISKEEAARLYRELSYRGWRTEEPGSVAVEEPRVLREVLTIHREEHGYSDDELAQIAQVTLPVLADFLPDYIQLPAERHLRVVSSRSSRRLGSQGYSPA